MVGLNKWFKDEFFSQTEGKTTVEMEAVKIDKGVILFWSVGNKLHKHFMPCYVIYVLQEETIKNAITEVKKSLA
jgi:hypothetical protein